MRKTLIWAMLSCLVLVACNAKKNGDNTVVLTGEITGTEGHGCLIYYDSLQNAVYPEFNLQDGQLQVEFRLSEPQVVSLAFWDDKFRRRVGPGMYLPTKSGTLQFVACPGQHLEINGTLDKDYMTIYPGGDKENDIFRQYTSTMFPVDNEMMNLELACQTDETLSEATKQEYRKIIAEKAKEIFRIKIDFLDKHVSSIGGLWLLDDMLLRSQLTLEQAEQYLQKVGKEYENILYYRNVATRIQGAKAAAEGQIAPDIRTQNTYDGKPFDLRDYRGKYVLLDFWGTWCSPCVGGLPEMKAFGAKHAGKLVLIGIAQDSEKNWRDYLGRSSWDWKQVLTGKGEEDFVLQYNVQGFPTKILIDPNGKILKRSVGEDPKFYEEVERLMK